MMVRVKKCGGGGIRWALCALFAGLLSCALSAGEIVIVTSSKAQPYVQARDAARKELQAAGYSCSLYRLDEVNEERLSKLAKDAPAAVLAVGSEAAAFLHERLNGSTPLCYCMVGDPDSAGLTKGNAAVGITTEVPLKTQFELVRRALPQAGVVGLLYSSGSEKGRALKTEVQSSLPNGWRLEAVAVEDHRSFSDAVDALLKRKVDLVWTWPDATLYNAAGVRALLLSALRNGIPVYGFSRPFVRAGALLGMGVEPDAQGVQAAEVLKGMLSNPNGPVQVCVHPPRANVIVNLIVADRLSIKLPGEVVRDAEEVIGSR